MIRSKLLYPSDRLPTSAKRGVRAVHADFRRGKPLRSMDSEWSVSCALMTRYLSRSESFTATHCPPHGA